MIITVSHGISAGVGGPSCTHRSLRLFVSFQNGSRTKARPGSLVSRMVRHGLAPPGTCAHRAAGLFLLTVPIVLSQCNTASYSNLDTFTCNRTNVNRECVKILLTCNKINQECVKISFPVRANAGGYGNPSGRKFSAEAAV